MKVLTFVSTAENQTVYARVSGEVWFPVCTMCVLVSREPRTSWVQHRQREPFDCQ